MILLIDNYDSFTFNLFQQMEALGVATKVVKHDKISTQEIEKLQPKKIVISPGPKRPEDAGISMEVINKFHTKIPILGVCLGHQCIGEVFGVRTIQAKQIMHGKTSKISHSGASIFKELPEEIEVARYHSLALEELPANFEKLAWTEDGEIMAMKHEKFPIYGIQFHPESFMTPDGNQLMQNFLNE